MSYSFSASGKSKAEARENAEATIKKVVDGQPIHGADQPLMMAGVDNALNALGDPKEDEIINISAYGSVGWEDALGDDTDAVRIKQCDFTIRASIISETTEGVKP